MDRILAIGCHPDDIEFMAAGTLALLAAEGYEIHLATLAGGEVGSATLRPTEIRAIRLKESAAAAAVLNGHYHYAGGNDLEVEYNDAYRKMATRIIRRVDPLIVFTHPPMDYMIPHEETSRVVRSAAYFASVPLYDVDAPEPPTTRFPYLYYWNAFRNTDIFGRPLPCHFGVDIGDSIEIKERMLACHASQRDWLAHHNKTDSYIAEMRGFSAADGRRIGRDWGECFIQHLSQGHPRDNIVAQILGERCVTLIDDPRSGLEFAPGI